MYDLKPDQTEIYIQSSIYQVYWVRFWHNRKCFIGNCHPSKTTVNPIFVSVNSGFLRVAISNVTFSCMQYLYNIGPLRLRVQTLEHKCKFTWKVTFIGYNSLVLTHLLMFKNSSLLIQECALSLYSWKWSILWTTCKDHEHVIQKKSKCEERYVFLCSYYINFNVLNSI